MTKTEAVSIFGSKKDLAAALGIHRSMISKLPEKLPIKYSDRTLGAAIREYRRTYTTAQTARAFGVTERWVRKVMASD